MKMKTMSTHANLKDLLQAYVVPSESAFGRIIKLNEAMLLVPIKI